MKKNIMLLCIMLMIINIHFNCFAADAQVPVVYISNGFDEGLNMLVRDESGGSIKREIYDDNAMCHFLSQSSTTSLSYVDVVSPNIAAINRYVIEADVIPVSVEGTSYIGLFDAKDVERRWRLGCRFYPSGEIVVYDSTTSSYIKAGEWEENVSIRVSLMYRLDEGVYDVYINGECALEGIGCRDIHPYIFRIDLRNPNGDGNLEFYVDNIRAYSALSLSPGKENLISDEDFALLDRTSVMDYTAIVREFLDGQQVYTVNGPYYFKDGQKQTYTSDEYCSVADGDKLYLSEKFLNDFLDIKISDISDTVMFSNQKYAPIEAAANKFGKAFYYDKRGFFIFSDDIEPYIDSDKFIEMYDPIDLIYRYIYFENPSGQKILADFDKNIEKGQHPRIIYNGNDIDFIKAQTGMGWNQVKAREVLTGDNEINYIDTNKPFTTDCSVSDKKNQASQFQLSIERLANAYILTNDSKYADKAIECMKILCSWDSIADKGGSEITIGHWAMGMAIGYDTFYDYMNSTEEGKGDLEFIKDAVVNIAFKDALNLYKGVGSNLSSGVGSESWINIRDNMSGVTAGGMLALVLTFADEEDIRQDVEYLLENIVKTLEITVSLFDSEGGFFEGLGYCEYLLKNFSLSLEALWKCCSTDYSIGSTQGFRKIGNFYVYMQTANSSFNFHDCSRGFIDKSFPYWLAYRYGQKETGMLWYNQHLLSGNTYDLHAMLLCAKGINFEASYDYMPLDYLFTDIDTGSFRNSFKYKNQVFAGFHGGWNGLSHDMLDLGQFVFEAEGVQWAIDLGKDSYELPSYFSAYTAYRKRPEGENCVVINPKVDSDTYPGQKTDAKAEVVMFKTAPKAAMAAIDLTQAYERDVNSYRRGYYFGDERNTFLIQDEINLKSESELYWFMHTKSEIEIVNSTTAKLTSNGKTLTAQLYCNQPEVGFTVMDAKPLDTSPVVEGQDSNLGVTKLTVYIPKAAGEVQIGVKLIPESPFYVASDITTAKIEDWELPDGEITKEALISNIKVNKANILSADVKIPDDSKSAELVIDGNSVFNIDVKKLCNTALGGIELSGISDGIHIAEIVAYDDSGESVRGSAKFEFNQTIPVFSAENKLNGYTGDTIKFENGWVLMPGNGTIDTSDSNSFTITSNSSNENIWLATVASAAGSQITDKAFVAECDIMFSSTKGGFVFECKGDATGWYMNNVALFEGGRMYNGDSYTSGTMYRVKLVVDPTNKDCSVFVNDKPIAYFPNISNLSELSTVKLQYTSAEAGESISYKNFKITEYDANTLLHYVFFENDGEKVLLKKKENIPNVSCNILIAGYNDNRMVSFEKYSVDEISSSGKEITVHSDADTLVAMVWNMSELIVPVCKIYCYRIK